MDANYDKWNAQYVFMLSMRIQTYLIFLNVATQFAKTV